MAEHQIVMQAKGYESDTIPGDFATLSNPCPKCGIGEIHEKYKKFQCTNPACDSSAMAMPSPWNRAKPTVP